MKINKERPLRILHFILGKASKDRANGVNQVVAGLAKYSARAGMDVRVIGKANSAAYEGEVIERDCFKVVVFSRWGAALQQAVREAIVWADVVHLHGTYALHNVWLGWICDAVDKPYIVTSHAGLAPERKALRGRVRKTIFHYVLQKRHLERAALLHALTEEESSDIVNLTKHCRVVVIPNGIDLEDFPSPIPRIPAMSPQPIRIGYIGRLSREKNLTALCEAFSALEDISEDLELLLAGPPSPEGETITKAWAGARIKFVGPRFGTEKISFLGQIDLVVLPSLSEGFPISAAETLALGLPMVITRSSNLTYFSKSDSFILCESTAFGLERGLRKALARRAEWPEMATRGRHLIESKLNWAAVTTEMLDVYRSISRSEA